MKPFLEQDRPEGVKKIYRALKRDHPEMSAEMKARIAARQGKPGKQKQGPPYKGPIKEAAELTTQGRKQISEGNFALPGRRYPIHDESHARNALARVTQHGTPEEQAKVRAAVKKKYPGIGEENMSKKSSPNDIFRLACVTKLAYSLAEEDPYELEKGVHMRRGLLAGIMGSLGALTAKYQDNLDMVMNSPVHTSERVQLRLPLLQAKEKALKELDSARRMRHGAELFLAGENPTDVTLPINKTKAHEWLNIAKAHLPAREEALRESQKAIDRFNLMSAPKQAITASLPKALGIGAGLGALTYGGLRLKDWLTRKDEQDKTAAEEMSESEREKDRKLKALGVGAGAGLVAGVSRVKAVAPEMLDQEMGVAQANWSRTWDQRRKIRDLAQEYLDLQSKNKKPYTKPIKDFNRRWQSHDLRRMSDRYRKSRSLMERHNPYTAAGERASYKGLSTGLATGALAAGLTYGGLRLKDRLTRKKDDEDKTASVIPKHLKKHVGAVLGSKAIRGGVLKPEASGMPNEEATKLLERSGLVSVHKSRFPGLPPVVRDKGVKSLPKPGLEDIQPGAMWEGLRAKLEKIQAGKERPFWNPARDYTSRKPIDYRWHEAGILSEPTEYERWTERKRSLLPRGDAGRSSNSPMSALRTEARNHPGFRDRIADGHGGE
jgi:hypothetical protein